ncbi:MAG: bifunctional glycosyltransferase family 2/GtrA family protein [Oscillospiraceae bacterium]|nr:bifunctional glycosyltransferase family 2/GtrA family protein [Oscillospiraceae bacterium]
MIALIPAYEPTEKLLLLIQDIKNKTDYTVLIIDDGSGKAYADIFSAAENAGCIVLTHPQNKGKGAALKTGFAYLKDYFPGESIVSADSDGQHSIEDIVRIADSVAINKSEMVVGVRAFDGKVPFKSKAGNAVSSLLFKAASGISLSDTQTGLRGYSFGMIDWLIGQKGDRFEYEFNLLLESRNAGVSIKQVPIRTIYENQNKGTHFRPFQDSVRVLLPIIKFTASSLTSAVLDFILLFVFQALTGKLFFGVLLARTVSSVYNYAVNRFVVFKARKVPASQSAPRYFALVVVMMFINYCLQKLLIDGIRINDVVAKVVTEIVLFILSYTVQNIIVFARRRTKDTE